MMNWKRKKERLYATISTLQELISIQDGYQECTGFTRNDMVAYIKHLHTITFIIIVLLFLCYMHNLAKKSYSFRHCIYLVFIQFTIYFKFFF